MTVIGLFYFLSQASTVSSVSSESVYHEWSIMLSSVYTILRKNKNCKYCFVIGVYTPMILDQPWLLNDFMKQKKSMGKFCPTDRPSKAGLQLQLLIPEYRPPNIVRPVDLKSWITFCSSAGWWIWSRTALISYQCHLFCLDYRGYKLARLVWLYIKACSISKQCYVVVSIKHQASSIYTFTILRPRSV